MGGGGRTVDAAGPVIDSQLSHDDASDGGEVRGGGTGTISIRGEWLSSKTVRNGRYKASLRQRLAAMMRA